MGPAVPMLLSVFPRRAPPGSQVTIFDLPDTVWLDLNGTPIIDFTRTADQRILASVPALPAGTYSLHGHALGSDQTLAGALTVDAAGSRATFAPGDMVAASNIHPNTTPGGPLGSNVQWLDPNGFFNQRWRTTLVTGAFFDPQGFLNVATADAVLRYDAAGMPAGSGPAFAKGASVVVYDREGRASVVTGTGISRYAADGTLHSPARRRGARSW